MQLLTRPVVMNLAKSVLTKSPTKFTAISAPALKKLNENALQNYSTERPKQNLLRFPAIPLEGTLAQFLKTCEPLLSSKELEETKKAAENFMKNEGAQLQCLLEETAQKEENWLASRWLKVAYLQWRDPVTVYCSPGMAFPIQKAFAGDSEYLEYTSKVIFCLVQYKQQVDNGEIPIVKMGKLELDNSQFEKVFGTCRIPKLPEDQLEYHPEARHVAVIYKNHFYKLPVYNEESKPLHQKVIMEQLQAILKKECEKGEDIGILSTDNRDNWAESYAELLKIKGNCDSISEIQKSLFTVSLDDEVPSTLNTRLKIQAAQLIHGGGSSQNGGNRWMDKTIQLIVNRNGSSGFCYEHSPAEGQPIALMVDYIVKNMLNQKFFECGVQDNYECASKLPLNANPCVTDLYIPQARRNLDSLVADLEINVLHYKGYGKAFIKQQKLSPDSYIQMAIQYAFYSLHGVAGAQYESAHLRIYVDGRTETIRSCSNESVAFAKAMLDKNVEDPKKIELLKAAVTGHSAYTKMALQGRGVDRHLLGLKLMALENGLPVPEFYQSPGFKKTSHFRISTSQVASAYEAWMAYGPGVDDGYACCYNPRENDIFLGMSSWSRVPDVKVDQFAEEVRKALEAMHQLLSKHGEKICPKL